MEIILGLLFVFGILAIYFLPSIIAVNRNHKNRIPIILVNILLGWSFVAWVLALVWSFTANTDA